MYTKVGCWLLLSILCFLCPPSISQSNPGSPHYVGAVVEYHPTTINGNIEAAAIGNALNYVTIIKKAKEFNSNLDIIVFPETALTDFEKTRNHSVEEIRKYKTPLASYVPNPTEKVTPCGDENTKVSKTLETLSCAAKEYKTYIVINHLEKEDCTNCSSDKINLYNSNIVFDRTGRIISRYRKYNLFVETDMNVTSEPEISTFETDFGVKFGQVICFDILHERPTLELLNKHQVTDIVHPLRWYGELPFLVAVECLAAWSYANNVNLLSSGYNNPYTGTTGSGIFSGTYERIPGVFRSETLKNVVLIANVPKVKNGVRSDKVKNETILYEFTDDEVSTIKNKSIIQSSFLVDKLSSFTTKLVAPEMDEFLTLCKDDFCCYFNHKAQYNMTVVKDGEKYYRYRFGAIAGVRYFGTVTRGVQVCGLMTCTDDSLSSCGQKFDAKETFKDWITFEKLKISTLLPRRENVTLFNMPTSLQTNLLPLNPSDFHFKSVAVNADYDFLSLNLIGPQKNLMAFGIYGRNFSADDSEPTIPSSASSMRISIFVTFFITILTLFGFKGKFSFL